MHFPSFILTRNEVGTRDCTGKGCERRQKSTAALSRAKIQQSRVRRWQQGHCWVEGQRWTDVSVVHLNVMSCLLQPPSSPCTIAPPNWKHSFQNADLIALLVFIKHSLYYSLWTRVVPHLECLWILINGVKLIPRLSTHFKFSPGMFPEQFYSEKPLQLNLLLKFLKITYKLRTTFRCLLLFTNKIKLIFPSLLLWMVLFCNAINRKKFYLLKKCFCFLPAKEVFHINYSLLKKLFCMVSGKLES